MYKRKYKHAGRAKKDEGMIAECIRKMTKQGVPVQAQATRLGIDSGGVSSRMKKLGLSPIRQCDSEF